MRGCVALIMAGGAGSRMARSHDHVPKAMIEVGGKPLVVWSIRSLVRAGIDHVCVAVHYRAQELIQLLRDRRDLCGAKLSFVVEEEPLGTIGSLAELDVVEDDVLVQNGDLLSGIDLGSMRAMHVEKSCDLTIATHIEQHRLKLGEVLTLPGGHIREYCEKPVKEYRISSGTYLVGPRVRSLCPRSVFTPFPDFVNEAISRGLTVMEFPHRAGWIDVNDAVDLQRAEAMFAEDPISFGVHPTERADRDRIDG